MNKNIFLLTIFLFSIVRCGNPPRDYKSCDKIYPLALLLLNDSSIAKENREDYLINVTLQNQRCKKRYDDYKKLSPFL